MSGIESEESQGCRLWVGLDGEHIVSPTLKRALILYMRVPISEWCRIVGEWDEETRREV